MPTIVHANGFSLAIYAMDDRKQGEHDRMHVHCRKAGVEVVIYLEALTVRNVKGMRPAEERLRRAAVERLAEIADVTDPTTVSDADRAHWTALAGGPAPAVDVIAATVAEIRARLASFTDDQRNAVLSAIAAR